jgi:hypothetical protein
MPNGGSDCCGTCWFNSRNIKDSGIRPMPDPPIAICTSQEGLCETTWWNATDDWHLPDIPWVVSKKSAASTGSGVLLHRSADDAKAAEMRGLQAG